VSEVTDRWIERQREAAILDEDEQTYLDRISDWQARARAEADKHNTHQNKRAVQNCPPSDAEAGALFCLFATWADRVYGIAKHTLQSHSETGHTDEPGLELEDLLQEGYILFQRAMVRAESENEMASRLRARMAEYCKSQLVERDDPDDRSPVGDDHEVAPGFSIPALYNELKEEDRLPRRAERLWDQLRPDAG